MRELLDGAEGERLERADYLADFDRHFWSIGEPGFWKLQRQQYFREPGYDTWEAFARGDWDESLRLLEDGRAAIADEHRRVDARGFSVRWVRVVEEPLTPYLQWELNVLRVREDCGSVVRVVRPHQVTALETAGPLPEIHTLGGTVMYQAIYGEDGALAGALRYTDPDLIARCQRVIADLHASGELLADYFEREVAGLKPPGGDL
jgi:hypothetical protein